MQQKFMIIGGASLKKDAISNFDQRIVELSGKQNPKILFIPTASKDDAGYVQRFTDYFTHLGGQVDLLLLYTKKLTLNAMQAKFEAADIIYVGGGNTLRMMNLWRKLGVDTLLKQAWQQGKVLCGSSAGSICWFNSGNSDSRKDNNPDAPYINVTALGFLDALHCPHYDSESARKASLKNMMQKHPGVAIALDDFAALEVIGDQCKIITARDKAQGYKVFWKNGLFYEELLEKETIRSLSDLLRK